MGRKLVKLKRLGTVVGKEAHRNIEWISKDGQSYQEIQALENK